MRAAILEQLDLLAKMTPDCGDSTTGSTTAFPAANSGSNPTSPLQFHFQRIANKAGVAANEEWHSILPSIPVFHVQIAYGAFFEDRLYAVALWGRPVARTICGLGYLELRRMAISENAPKNTASRMLAWMAKDIRKIRTDIVKLISYQDTSHHKGTIYKAAGWTPVDRSASPVNWGGASQTLTPPTRKRSTKLLMAPKVRWEFDIVKN
jgi:hypothetical protein